METVCELVPDAPGTGGAQSECAQCVAGETSGGSDPFPRTWPVSRRTQSGGPRVVLALKFSVARVLVS